MSENIKVFFEELSKCWNALPKELRVGLYIVASAILAELTKYLSQAQVDSKILMAIYNIILVSIQQLPARLKR